MSGPLDRYFQWGPDLRPWPGEVEYLRTKREGPYFVAPATPWDGRGPLHNIAPRSGQHER